MIIADVNVLLYAMWPRFPQHEVARRWLGEALAGSEPFGTWEPILAATYRVATLKSVFDAPGEPRVVLAFIDSIRSSPSHTSLVPSPRMWTIFQTLLTEATISGADTTDALYAALVIDQNATFATFDHGFARFRGLKWVMPT